MLSLDATVSPDPFLPVALDAYGINPVYARRTSNADIEVVTPGRPHACIVLWIDSELREMCVCWNGNFVRMADDAFPVFLSSAGLKPTGRMVRPVLVAKGQEP